MPAKAQHYQAAEIARLIDQLARWPGWNGCSSSSSSMAWLADMQSRRRADEFGPSIPVLGGESADTMEALRRIDPLLAECLTAFYSVRGTVDRRVWEVNRRRRGAARISRRTFYRVVDEAHPAFWAQYVELRMVARQVGKQNAATVHDASRSVARRWRLVPTITSLVEPQKTSVASTTCGAATENGQ